MKTLTTDIRRAEPRDADGIAAAHAEAWRGAYAGIIPHKTLTGMINRRGGAWWLAAIRRGTPVLIVEVGGTIAGYATLGRSRARSLPAQGEVYELYLKPEYQGIGLGSRLLRAARRTLSERGLRGLVVWALADNSGAVDFYEGAGGRGVAETMEVFEKTELKKIAFLWD